MNKSTTDRDRLFQAIDDGDLESMRKILRQFPLVNVGANGPEGGDETLLHRALKSKHDEATQIAAVHLLIQAGCSVRPIDERESTPLHFAAEEGQTRVCTMLSEYGSNHFKLDKHDKLPMTLARIGGHEETYLTLVAAVSEFGRATDANRDEIRAAASDIEARSLQRALDQKQTQQPFELASRFNNLLKVSTAPTRKPLAP